MLYRLYISKKIVLDFCDVINIFINDVRSFDILSINSSNNFVKLVNKLATYINDNLT
jgi:hypothetical protein